MTDVKVEQCDVDRARELVGLPADPSAWPTDRAVLAFARHRQAAEKATQMPADLVQRACEIVEWRRTGIYSGTALKALAKSRDWNGTTRLRAAEDATISELLATAIRSQGHE